MIGELFHLVGHFVADLLGLTVGARSDEEGDDQRRREQAQKLRRTLPFLLVGSVILIALLVLLISGARDALGPFFDAPWWGPSGSGEATP